MSSLTLWMEEWHKQEDIYRVGSTANPPNVLDIVKLYFSLSVMKSKLLKSSTESLAL